MLKGANWIPGGQWSSIITSSVASLLASSITFSVGRAFQYYFENNMEAKFEDVEEVFKSAYKQYKESKGNI